MTSYFITKDDRQIDSGYSHVRVGRASHFGWWVGVLRHRRNVIWQCGHQHSDKAEAERCAGELADAVNGYSDSIRLRREW